MQNEHLDQFEKVYCLRFPPCLVVIESPAGSDSKTEAGEATGVKIGEGAGEGSASARNELVFTSIQQRRTALPWQKNR
eukprot:4696968-Amphidinium_carterae.1